MLTRLRQGYGGRGSESYREEINDLSRKQRVEYFNRHAETGPLASWWKKVRRHPRPTKSG